MFGFGKLRRQLPLMKNDTTIKEDWIINGTHTKLESRCKICGIYFEYNPKNRKRIYCSRICRYKDHSNIVRNSYTKELRQKRSILTTSQWKKTEDQRALQKKIQYESMNHVLGRPKTRIIQTRVCKQCNKSFDYFSADRSGMFCNHKCYLQFSRENSTNYRIKAFALLPNECFYCQGTEKGKLLVHHIDKDWLNNDIENLQILCTNCHRKQHKGDNSRFKKFKEGDILRGIRLILSGLRVDLKDENFKGTPERVLRSYYELFEGIDSEKELEELFSESFPSNYEGMIIVDPIICFSMCPHHLLQIEYEINIAYIAEPSQHRKMLGLSKIARIAQLLSRRLVLQESLTHDIASAFMKNLNANGVMVVVKGKHNCMRTRGINKPESKTITSTVRGTFEKDSNARLEFLALVNK